MPATSSVGRDAPDGGARVQARFCSFVAPQVSLVDVASGALLPDTVPDLLTTTSRSRYRVTWLPDSSGFVYPRLAPGAMQGPANLRLARGRQTLHRLGTPASEDIALFGDDTVPGIAIAADDLPAAVVMAPGSRWIAASLARVKEDRSELWVARIDDVLAHRARWRKISDAGHAQAALRGDTLFAVTAQDADRRRIVARDLAVPDAGWSTAVPERDGVIRGFVVTADALYFTELCDARMRLYRVPGDGAAPQPISLPVDGGGMRFAPQDPTLRDAWIEAQQWTSPGGWFRVPPTGDGAVAVLIDAGGAALDSDDLIVEQRLVPVGDDVRVPVSIIRQRTLARDGSAPLLLEVYGGYGSVKLPSYDPNLRTWVRQGAIYAYAHVRGGGELGDAWRTSALRENKIRSTTDTIAVADALIAARYTRAGRIALLGTSAGAQIPGLAVVRRPELFGAAVFNVGTLDEIRGAQLDPTAARNIAEMGDMDSPQGVALLKQYSPYQQVPARIALPAMLVKSAADDYNFGTVATTAKYVARLQAANDGARPVVWLNLPGGHSDLFGSDPDATAQAMAFLLWQTGHAAFQPGADRPVAVDVGK